MAKEIPVKLSLVAVDNATAPLRKVQASVADLGKEVKRVEGAFKGVDFAQRKLGISLQKTGKSIADFGKKSSLYLTAPISAGATVGLMEFAKVQGALTDLKSELAPDTFGPIPFEEGFAKLANDFKDLSSKTGIGTQEIVTAFDDIQDRTGNVAESMARLSAASELAKVKNASLAESTKVLNTVMQAYKLPASEAEATAGRLLSIMNESGASMEDMTAGMADVSTRAAQLGIPLEDIAAVLEQGKLAGLDAGQSFTAIQQIMKGLTKTTATATAESKRLGVNFGTNAVRTYGLVGLFKKLSASKNLDAKSGEKLFKGVQAQTLATSILANKSKILEKAHNNLASAKQAEGLITASLAAKQDTLTVAAGKALNNFRLLMSEIFEPLAPVLTALANAFGPLRDFFRNHKVIAGMTSVLLIFLAVLGPIIWAVGQLIISVGAILTFMAKWELLVAKFPKSLGLLQKAFNLISKAWGWFVRLLANPQVIFQVLRTAIIWLVEAFGTFLGILGTVMQFLWTFVAIPIIITAGIIAWASAIWNLITNWAVFVQAFKDAWAFISEGFSKFLSDFLAAEGVTAKFTVAVDALASAWQAVWDIISGVYSEMVKLTETGIGKVAGFLGLGPTVAENTGAAPMAPAALPNTTATRVAQNQQRNVSTTNNASVDVNFKNLPKDARVSSEGGDGPFLLNLGLAGQ